MKNVSNLAVKEYQEKKKSLFDMLINSNCIDELCSAMIHRDDKDNDLFVVKMLIKLDEDFRTHTLTEKEYDLGLIKSGLSSLINIHIENYPEDEPEMLSWKESIDSFNKEDQSSLSLVKGSV